MKATASCRLSTQPLLAVPQLSDLPRVLSRWGYSDFVASFMLYGSNLALMADARNLAPPGLRVVLDLFLFGQPVQENDLPESLRALLPMLERYGIVERHADAVVSTGLSLLFVCGKWIFAQQLRPSPAIYFGDDSLALMRRLTPPPSGKVLDLCSGPGTLAIHCAHIAAETIAVELNPAASAVAYLNVLLNGLEDRISLRIGDLYAPVKGKSFDLICANPPLIPLPEGLEFPFVGHGGADGLAITRRIIRDAPGHLNDQGSVQIIGTSLSDGLSPQVVEHLEEALPSTLDAFVTVTAHMPCRRGDWQFEMLVNTAKRSSLAPDARKLLEEALVAARGSHLAYFFLRLEEGSRSISVMDLSREGGERHLWYA